MPMPRLDDIPLGTPTVMKCHQHDPMDLCTFTQSSMQHPELAWCSAGQAGTRSNGEGDAQDPDLTGEDCHPDMLELVRYRKQAIHRCIFSCC